MSIVLNVVTPYASWIVTDGRATTKDAVYENVRKCQSFGNRFYIGYTGTLEYAEAAMELLRLNCTNPKTAALEDVTAYLLVVSRHLRTVRKDDAQFIITGPRKDGQLGSCTISKSCEYQVHYPAGDEIKVTTLSPLEDFHATQYFRPCPTGMPFELYLRSTMKEVVSCAAELDDSINTNTTFYVIYLNPKTGEVQMQQD